MSALGQTTTWRRFWPRPLCLEQRTNSEAMGLSALCRYCCKSPKLKSDDFPARRRRKSKAQINVASGSLPRSPVSLSSSDEAPHIFTRKARLRLGETSISCAKRVLQQNLPIADIDRLFDHLVGAGEQRRRYDGDRLVAALVANGGGMPWVQTPASIGPETAFATAT